MVESAETSLSFALTGAGGKTDPLELSLERRLTCLVGFFFGGQSRLFLLQPRRVVTFPGDAVSAIEFENPLRGVVEKVTVVGNGDDGAAVVLKGALEPGHRLGVEVVRRLVKK